MRAVAVAGIAWRWVAQAGGLDGVLAYGTLARGDSILYGAALAVTGFRWPRLWPAAAVALVLAVSVARFDALGSVGPVLIGLASCVLIEASPSIRVLAWRPLVEIGRRSYGIYLWHMFPVLVVRPFLPSPLAVVFVVAFTALASWASFRWIEQPVRRREVRWPAPVAAWRRARAES